MIERKGNNVKVNLTVPFLIWTVVFVVVAALTGDGVFWWVAALPWLFVLGFVVLAVIIGTVAFVSAYWRGVPITLTGRYGQKRTIVRKGKRPGAKRYNRHV